MSPRQLDALSDAEVEQLFAARRLSDEDMLYLVQTRVSPEMLAKIDAIAYGIAKLFHTPIDQLSAEATQQRARHGAPPRLDAGRKVSDMPVSTYNVPHSGEPAMTNPSVGVDMFERYRDVASDAVRAVRRQAPVLGYYRLGLQQHIYLFPTIQDARAWFDRRGQIPSYDYVAVFLAKNTRAPLLEDFGRPAEAGGDPQVGHWLLPLALGVPAGAYAGWRYRQWQEAHPGKIFPLISGEGVDPHVAPGVDPRILAFRRAASSAVWRQIEVDGDSAAPSYLYVDIHGHGHVTGHQTVDEINAYVAAHAHHPGFRYAAAFHMGPDALVFDAEATPGNPVLVSGGPWVDVVGAYPWMSIHDVGPSPFVPRGPWLDIVGGGPWVDVVGVDRAVLRQRKRLIQSAIQDLRAVVAAPWWADAYAFLWYLDPSGVTQVIPYASYGDALEAARGSYGLVATAVFDRSSSHWPNPVAWHLNDDPSYAGVIAQQASYAPPRTAGVGSLPWYTIVGEALDALRRQAKVAAEGLPGQVVGVRRDGGNRWELRQFRSVDDADDWFGHATRDPSSFTYAAYFDKADVLYPDPLNEKIGGARAHALPGAPIPRGIAEAS